MSTNFTAEDLKRIDQAIAQGVLEVSFADGRKVRFSTFDELVQRRHFIARQLGETAGRQRIFSHFTRGFVP